MTNELISRRFEDLTGKRFGKLTVIEHAGEHIAPCGTKRQLWRCVCDCGAEKVVQSNNLKNGTTVSCGCHRLDKIIKHNTVHGGSHDRLYEIWKSMKRRCNSHNDKHYSTYGGRGIRVCREWADSYQSFKDWAYENGYDDSANFQECTLDRIDNNGNYEPSNCRFVGKIEQMNNMSTNRHVTFNGEKMTIAEFSRMLHIDPMRARYYIDKHEREVANG